MRGVYYFLKLNPNYWWINFGSISSFLENTVFESIWSISPRYSKCDTCRNRLRFDPEWNPGHDDDQASRDVGMEEVVAQPTFELEDDLQTSELP